MFKQTNKDKKKKEKIPSDLLYQGENIMDSGLLHMPLLLQYTWLSLLFLSYHSYEV